MKIMKIRVKKSGLYLLLKIFIISLLFWLWFQPSLDKNIKPEDSWFGDGDYIVAKCFNSKFDFIEADNESGRISFEDYEYNSKSDKWKFESLTLNSREYFDSGGWGGMGLEHVKNYEILTNLYDCEGLEKGLTERYGQSESKNIRTIYRDSSSLYIKDLLNRKIINRGDSFLKTLVE